jgi:hypothetical protein
MVGIISLFILIAVPTAFAGATLPVFADHPATERFSGAPTLPDIKSAPDVKKFTSRIREGARQGPNFAGRYTIVDWGCGSDCQSFVIVDAKTGVIHTPAVAASRGLLYRIDSSLLIVNPLSPDSLVDGKAPDWLVTGFYQWDGKKLNKLAESRDMIIDPQTGAANKPDQPKQLTVIDYYNMNKHDYLRIEQRDGVWKGQGDSGWHALKVADIANGYVEYEDPGHNNGAGHAAYSGALFLTKDRQPLFALLQTITSTEQKCPDRNYTIETYRMNGDQMAEATDAAPLLGFFMKKGSSAEIGIDFHRLPSSPKGTTVEAFMDTSNRLQS